MKMLIISIKKFHYLQYKMKVMKSFIEAFQDFIWNMDVDRWDELNKDRLFNNLTEVCNTIDSCLINDKTQRESFRSDLFSDILNAKD